MEAILSKDGIEREIRAFLIDNFLFGEDDGFDRTTSFIDSGLIDSTGVLELVSFLEERFEISVGDDDLIPENLDSLERVSSFVERKQVAAGAGAGAARPEEGSKSVARKRRGRS